MFSSLHLSSPQSLSSSPCAVSSNFPVSVIIPSKSSNSSKFLVPEQTASSTLAIHQRHLPLWVRFPPNANASQVHSIARATVRRQSYTKNTAAIATLPFGQTPSTASHVLSRAARGRSAQPARSQCFTGCGRPQCTYSHRLLSYQTRQGEEIDYGRSTYLGYTKGPSPDKPAQAGKTMPAQDARNIPGYGGREYGMGTTTYGGQQSGEQVKTGGIQTCSQYCSQYCSLLEDFTPVLVGPWAATPAWNVSCALPRMIP
ncbi:hypothetical protein GE09DRAFT_1294209 [Coniochaeta sp. 2T2.1]|nr:hypothetical protein GE09DRAFT_1294209 [Coniochaeta sp. 2T2.1]